MTLLALVLGVVLASPGAVQAATATTFTYDANGNLTAKTEGGVVWTYAYDARNQLSEVLRDGLIFEAYQYDAQGRRIRKTSADGIVRYVGDDDHIILESDDFGNTIASYRYDGDRLLSVHHVTEGIGFYLLDALGSPTGLMRPEGSLAARYKLDAWGVLGAQTGDSSSPFRFTGHFFDEATELYYAKARYYDPQLGRFLTEDPVQGDPVEPRSQHPYLYAYANPTVYVDLDGRCVGSLQQTEFCQEIARSIAYVIGGDPEAEVERQVERRQKVVRGRRDFRAQMGRDPLPNEVVWFEGNRALRSNFQEIDTSGRVEPDYAEWAVVGAGFGNRIAVSSARASGASTVGRIIAGATQLGDEAIGQVTGVSPGDIAGLTRMATQGLAPRRLPNGQGRPSVTIAGESASGPGVDLIPVETAIVASRAPVPGEGQIASAYPKGRRVAGAREGRRAGDPAVGFRETGAFDWTPDNVARMERGQPQLGTDARPVELHHRNQDPAGPIDEMTSTTHQGVEHPNRPSQIDRDRFAGERRRYWIERVREAHGQGQAQLTRTEEPH